MTIAIDFDGTIAMSRFPHINGMMPGAKQAIKDLREHGHYIIIWTCRTDKDLVDAVNWMLAEGIEFDRVNDEAPDNIAQFGGRKFGKINADIYIDDRNLGGFPGWKEVLKILLND